jgi:SAM-dependent methyltransferase
MAENASMPPVSEVLFLPDECVPDDHCRQTTATAMAEQFLRGATPAHSPIIILDLGCGDGNSIDFFRKRAPAARWIGVDIAGSPEVLSRRRTDADFRTFDGVHIPADDASIDLVFCNQAITHAEHPLDLLRDVRRILKPTGQLIGSTSHLEPIVSYSRTNFTPFGFGSLLTAAGLELREIRPGIDALTLILRRFLWKPWIFDRFYETESPLNRVIEFAGHLRHRSPRQINTRKLLFAGQFVFRAGQLGEVNGL